MQAQDIKIGMEVLLNGDRWEKATVQSLPDENGSVKIERHFMKKTQTISCTKLSLADPEAGEADKYIAAQVQAKLDLAKSNFEQAFLAFQEAQEIARKYGSSVSEMSYYKIASLKDLEGVLETNGWNSSSLMC